MKKYKDLTKEVNNFNLLSNSYNKSIINCNINYYPLKINSSKSKTIKRPCKLTLLKLKKLKLSLYNKRLQFKTNYPISKRIFKTKLPIKLLLINKSNNSKRNLLKWLLKPTILSKILIALNKVYTTLFKLHFILIIQNLWIKDSIFL